MPSLPAPPVSVALATYNGRRWLPAQLDSVLSQLAADDEVVLVDDASADGTADWIAQRGDSRVRLLASPVNRGVRASFARALASCRGRHVFLCDQDDVWLPGKRDALVAALQGGAVLALSDAQVIDADGHVIFVHTLVKNRYLGCAMAFRRDLLDEALPIPHDVPMHDMWIGALAALRGPVAYIDRPLMQYRRHGANVSPERRAGLARMLTWRWQLLRAVAARRLRGPRRVTPEAHD
ncbi:MAG: glycosyltransferase family 2 protein [Burkholderiaceae bacterium]|nr:glycosyltransferase family 2 protein [Burkholderiaceae bacterium]